MPDITSELGIIANEPKGRLVKQAIYDALLKINEAADMRPPALQGVPIGEVVIDTGWIEGSLVGRIGAGEIREFDGKISEGGISSGSTYSARVQMNVTDPGRVFLVAMQYVDSEEPEITNIAGDVEWELVGRYSLKTYSYDVAKYEFQSTYPDATLKGYVYSSSELPDPDDADINDTYVDNVHRTLYVCTEHVSGKEWDELFGPADWLNDTRAGGPRIYIWSSTIQSDITVDVRIDVEALSVDPEHLSAAMFAVYDKDGFNASSLPYHISLIDTGTKAFDNPLKQHFKGKVETRADLPEQQVSVGDIYYVEDPGFCYERYLDDDDEPSWRRKYVYSSENDSYAVTHDDDGIHARTSRIFLCASYNPNPTQAIPHLTCDQSRTSMTPVAYLMAGGSYLSAWHQEHGNVVYPIFDYCFGSEEYVNLYDGSVAVLVIEIGESLGGGAD